jgi:hypothetical protein
MTLKVLFCIQVHLSVPLVPCLRLLQANQAGHVLQLVLEVLALPVGPWLQEILEATKIIIIVFEMSILIETYQHHPLFPLVLLLLADLVDLGFLFCQSLQRIP